MDNKCCCRRLREATERALHTEQPCVAEGHAQRTCRFKRQKPNPYLIFLQCYIKKYTGTGIPARQLFVQAGQKWQQMSNRTREMYRRVQPPTPQSRCRRKKRKGAHALSRSHIYHREPVPLQRMDEEDCPEEGFINHPSCEDSGSKSREMVRYTPPRRKTSTCINSVPSYKTQPPGLQPPYPQSAYPHAPPQPMYAPPNPAYGAYPPPMYPPMRPKPSESRHVRYAQPIAQPALMGSYPPHMYAPPPGALGPPMSVYPYTHAHSMASRRSRTCSSSRHRSNRRRCSHQHCSSSSQTSSSVCIPKRKRHKRCYSKCKRQRRRAKTLPTSGCTPKTIRALSKRAHCKNNSKERCSSTPKMSGGSDESLFPKPCDSDSSTKCVQQRRTSATDDDTPVLSRPKRRESSGTSNAAKESKPYSCQKKRRLRRRKRRKKCQEDEANSNDCNDECVQQQNSQQNHHSHVSSSSLRHSGTNRYVENSHQSSKSSMQRDPDESIFRKSDRMPRCCRKKKRKPCNRGIFAMLGAALKNSSEDESSFCCCGNHHQTQNSRGKVDCDSS